MLCSQEQATVSGHALGFNVQPMDERCGGTDPVDASQSLPQTVQVVGVIQLRGIPAAPGKEAESLVNGLV